MKPFGKKSVSIFGVDKGFGLNRLFVIGKCKKLLSARKFDWNSHVFGLGIGFDKFKPQP